MGNARLLENPISWTTNNFYTDFKPVAKYDDAISGQYSMKISSSARDANGLPTWPGCAHVKFLPTQLYLYAGASVRIDSIEDGRIEIRIKQRQPNGFYVKIGGWKDSVATKIVQQVWMPLAMTSMDSLLIEVWAFNKDTPPYLENKTFAEAIVDDIVLTNTNAINDPSHPQTGQVSVFPNPADGKISIALKDVEGISEVYVINAIGHISKKMQPILQDGAITLDVSELPEGIWFLNLLKSNKRIPLKFVIAR
ncbi:MAG: T9SS type A sorting domain-containing protein [Saprospiraceae bacterium]|nr:T9SS type A sorting domain-containing protein [Saprospiraceae bacterium]